MPDTHDFTLRWSMFDDQAISDLSRLASFLGPNEFPAYHRAAEALSEKAETLYFGYLSGEPTPAGKAIARPSGTTARGVKREHTGLLAWTLKNESKAALALEEGTKERDMKECLPTSKRARKSKSGHLYLIIPFRHGVPGTRGLSAMSKDVYRLAKRMAFSRVIGAPSTRVSATGWTVPKWTYRWQGRLPDVKKLQALGFDEGTSRRVAGMVRMSKRGHTSYMTFRVMSQASAPGSWVRPTVPGLWPLRWAVDQALQDGEPMLLDAIQADLWQALGLAKDGF